MSLQLLDDGLKSLETISVEANDTAGMPNMAVLPWPNLLLSREGRCQAGQGPRYAANQSDL
jgi:hypothetical protein